MSESNAAEAYRIFTEALLLQGDQRKAFMEENCKDEALRRAVEQMLEGSEKSDAHVFPGLTRFAREAMASTIPQAQTGDTIGPYRLVRKLGQGGMGTVFLAERADDLALKVAIKFPHDFQDTSPGKQFKRERDILASLKHPGIAQLFDAGTTERGQPYFIMEYVEGLPIDTYCHENNLDFWQRLTLLRKVCDAVSFAHRNLVLHRDLKPANLLVTPNGEPKLLDFGISELINPSPSLQLTQTILGMTPAFASPEQLDQQRLSAASDVYALGVLAYKLLTQFFPISPEALSPMAFFEKVRSNDIPPPSSLAKDCSSEHLRSLGTTASGLKRLLKGDMDALLLQALAGKPNERYPSVEAFSAEMDRFRTGLPLKARSHHFGYQLLKFTKLYKWPIATLVLFLTLMLSFSLVLLHQKGRIEAERNSAQRERDTSQQVARFLAQTFQGADPNTSPGQPMSAVELLDQGSLLMHSQLGDQPLVRANLLSIMGSSYRNLGEYAKAEPLLSEALTLQKGLLGAESEEALDTSNQLGLLFKDMGHYDKAEVLLTETLAIRRTQLNVNGLVSALNSLGQLLSEQGRKEETLTLLKEAYARGGDSSDHIFAGTVHNLGLLLKEMGRNEEAEPFLLQALSLHRRMYPNPHPAIATSLNNLGLLAKDRGLLDAAEAYWQEALAMRREIYASDHPKILTSLNNLGAVLRDRGDLNAAEPIFREVLALKRTQYSPNHPRLITSLNNLGMLLLDKGSLSDAEAFLLEAQDIAANKLASEHFFHGVLARNLALLRLDEGRHKEGIALAMDARNRLRKTQKADSLHLTLAEMVLGGAYLASGRYGEAEPLLERSLERLRLAQESFPLHIARTTTWLQELYRKTGQTDRLAALQVEK